MFLLLAPIPTTSIYANDVLPVDLFQSSGPTFVVLDFKSPQQLLNFDKIIKLLALIKMRKESSTIYRCVLTTLRPWLLDVPSGITKSITK